MVGGVGAAIAIGAGTAAENYAASNAGTRIETLHHFQSTPVLVVLGYLGGTAAAGQTASRLASFGRMDRGLNRIEKLVQRMRDDA